MDIDATMAALADPTRRELLSRLARRASPAGDLARGFAMTRPAVCKHMRVLREAGLIRASKEGRRRIYELRPRGRVAVEQVRKTIEEVSRFWDTALEAFKNFVERDHQP
jgi:DNA-binding transcriptional ArsR family regulator